MVSKFLVLIAALIPVSIICYLSYRIADKVLTDEIKQGLNIFAEKKTQATDNFMYERTQDIYQFSHLPTIKSLFANSAERINQEVLAQFIKQVLNDTGFEQVYAVNSNNQIIYSSQNASIIGKKLAELNDTYKFLEEIYNLSSTLLSPDVVFGQSIDEKLDKIFISSPVFDKGLYQGSLILTLKPEALKREIFQSLSINESHKYVATRQNGKVKIAYTNDKAFSNKSPQADEIFKSLDLATQGENGYKTVKDASGRAYIYIYRYIPEMNMGFLMTHDSSIIYDRSQWLKKRVIFLYCIGVTAILYLTIWGMFRVRKLQHRHERLIENHLPQVLHKFIDKPSHANEVVTLDRACVVRLSIDKIDVLPEHASFLAQELQLICNVYNYMQVLSFNGTTFFISQEEQKQITNLDFCFAIAQAVKLFNQQYESYVKFNIFLSIVPIEMLLLDAEEMRYDLITDKRIFSNRMIDAPLSNSILITKEAKDALVDVQTFDFVALDNDGYRVTPKLVVDKRPD